MKVRSCGEKNESDSGENWSDFGDDLALNEVSNLWYSDWKLIAGYITIWHNRLYVTATNEAYARRSTLIECFLSINAVRTWSMQLFYSHQLRCILWSVDRITHMIFEFSTFWHFAFERTICHDRIVSNLLIGGNWQMRCCSCIGFRNSVHYIGFIFTRRFNGTYGVHTQRPTTHIALPLQKRTRILNLAGSGMPNK